MLPPYFYGVWRTYWLVDQIVHVAPFSNVVDNSQSLLKIAITALWSAINALLAVNQWLCWRCHCVCHSLRELLWRC